ncbi:hypothetical protein BRC83_05260 [Halobacteriales archaeon QS_1_68_17]|nr:MAG: hypothetical protein BRC83_05260 [Halobacteriales archaeon QS_1_68_17]
MGETRFSGESERSPSVAIIEAVAAAEGVPPGELDPLYETIDPDLMDRLLADRSDPSTPPKLIRFSFAGWNVFVRGDGVIRVCDPDRLTDPAPAFQKSIGN